MSLCYIMHFSSDSASIFQQCVGMTAPNRRGMSVIAHPHAAHLPYLPEPTTTVIVAVLYVNFWFSHFSGEGVVSVCYSITQGVGLEKCCRVLHWVNGWCRLLLNGVVCTMQDKLQAAETLFEAAVTFEPHSILAWTMYGA